MNGIHPENFTNESFLILMHTRHVELLDKARAHFPMIPDERVIVLFGFEEGEALRSHSGVGKAVYVVECYFACNRSIGSQHALVCFPDTTVDQTLAFAGHIIDVGERLPAWYKVTADGNIAD